MAETERSVGEQSSTAPDASTDGPWATIVWDDPVNLMSYVVYVFRTHFGFSRPTAISLMRTVHESGCAVVARTSRESAERHVAAMHSYGLRATMEKRA